MSKKSRKRPKLQEEITPKDLENTYFVPIKRMNEVLNFIGAPAPPVGDHLIRCSYNLLSLKHERSTREYYDELYERYSSGRHQALLVSACYKALYAHDWDRLLYILKQVPKWRINNMHTFHTRVLTVLLMYHPDSQAKGFLNEYLHMVWGCRSEQDKKAIQKVILSLTRQMSRTPALQKFWLEYREQRKRAFAEMTEKNNSEE